MDITKQFHVKKQNFQVKNVLHFSEKITSYDLR